MQDVRRNKCNLQDPHSRGGVPGRLAINTKRDKALASQSFAYGLGNLGDAWQSWLLRCTRLLLFRCVRCSKVPRINPTYDQITDY